MQQPAGDPNPAGLMEVEEEEEEEVDPLEREQKRLRDITAKFQQAAQNLNLANFEQDHRRFIDSLGQLTAKRFVSVVSEDPAERLLKKWPELGRVEYLNIQHMVVSMHNFTSNINEMTYQQLQDKFPMLRKPQLAPFLDQLSDILLVLTEQLYPAKAKVEGAPEAAAEGGPPATIETFIKELQRVNLDSLEMRLFYNYFQQNRQQLGALTRESLARLVSSDFSEPSLMQSTISAEDLFLRQRLPEAAPKEKGQCPGTSSTLAAMLQYNPFADPKNLTYGELGMSLYRQSGTPFLP